jgi:hypothetical protein
MRSPTIEKTFPYLASGDYKITSPPTCIYNCIAWAANNDTMWWWPDPQDIYFWPTGILREVSLRAFILAFESRGYSICDNQDLEEGYEKIAIFTDASNNPTHAARQLNSGKWTSKLGGLEDIEHELDGVSGELYGKISVVWKSHSKN